MLSKKNNNWSIHFVIISFLLGVKNYLPNLYSIKKNNNKYRRLVSMTEESFKNIFKNLENHSPMNPQLKFLLIKITL